MPINAISTGSPVWLTAPEDPEVAQAPTARTVTEAPEAVPARDQTPGVTPVPGAGPVGEVPGESLPPAFDPPLIAQRAALGWPVGPMIVEYARDTQSSYGAVQAKVAAATAALGADAAKR